MSHRVSPQGLALIRHFEAFSPVPYRCPAGVWTIGYGHAITAAERAAGIFSAPLDEAAAEALLARDVSVAEAALNRLVYMPLTEGQRDALVSFTFNLGAGALQRSTLRRKVNRGEHESVPEELMKWVWAGGRKLPGLIRRRRMEGERYVGG